MIAQANLTALRESAETAARPFLEDERLFAAVVQAIREVQETRPTPPSTAPELPLDVRRAVEAFLEGGTLDDVVQPERFWVLIAEALAAVAISGSASASHVAATRARLGDSPAWVHDVWSDACKRRLGELAPAELDIWLNEFGRMPNIEREDQPGDRAVVVLRTSASWKVSDSFQLWSEDPVAFHAMATWAPLNLLHDYDLVRWLGAIDRWSDPRLVHGALFSAGARETEADFLRLIRAARPCFTEDGMPTDACAAVVLCDSALQHVQREFDNKTEKGRAETLAYLQLVVGAVRERPDGKILMLALAAKVADEAFLTDNTNRIPSTVPALAWEALAPELLGCAYPVAEQRAVQEQRGQRAPNESGPVRRALPSVVVALRTLGDRRGADVEALLAWLADALSSPTDWADRATVNYLLTVVVDTLALVEQPVAATHAMFAALEPTRRRWECSRPYVFHHGELPSLLLLVALATLILRGQSEQPEADLAFVRDRALRLALTGPEATEPVLRAREVIAIALEVACSVFGAGDERTAALAQPVANEREVLGHLLHRLASGARPDDVFRLLEKLARKSDAVLAVATEWAAATGHPFDMKIAEATINALTKPVPSS